MGGALASDNQYVNIWARTSYFLFGPALNFLKKIELSVQNFDIQDVNLDILMNMFKIYSESFRFVAADLNFWAKSFLKFETITDFKITYKVLKLIAA